MPTRSKDRVGTVGRHLHLIALDQLKSVDVDDFVVFTSVNHSRLMVAAHREKVSQRTEQDGVHR
jgi:hypothetical protein